MRRSHIFIPLFIILSSPVFVLAQAGGERMIRIGRQFIGTPYVAHTLEVGEREELVINQQEVDCTTFVEYVLARSLAADEGNGQQFADFLRQIRYRNGRIEGYTSRLHYITEWIANGVRAHLLEDVTARHAATFPLTIRIDYMSTHPNLYKRLAHSPCAVSKMKEVEDALSGLIVCYLPKSRLPSEGLPWIKEGDIIALTTDIAGLDVAHMGIATYVDGYLHLLHASYTHRQVEVSEVPLAWMLKRNKRWTGIRVVRIKERKSP